MKWIVRNTIIQNKNGEMNFSVKVYESFQTKKKTQRNLLHMTKRGECCLDLGDNM